MTHLGLAESELKYYQVDSRDPLSQSMKYRGTKAQAAFDEFVTGRYQQSHTLGTKAESPSTTDSPSATLLRTELAAVTDLAPHTELVSQGHYVARIDT